MHALNEALYKEIPAEGFNVHYYLSGFTCDIQENHFFNKRTILLHVSHHADQTYQRQIYR